MILDYHHCSSIVDAADGVGVLAVDTVALSAL
jgi:hypothetical protein